MRPLHFHEIHLSNSQITAIVTPPSHASQPNKKDQVPATKPRRNPLLLSSSGLISLLLRPLITLALVSVLASRISQLSVCTSLDWCWQLALLDLRDTTGGVNDWQTKLDAGNGVLGGRDILLGSITLLVLTQLAGEEDQAGLVCL